KSDLINKNIGEVFDKYASEELREWTTGEGMSALESATYGGAVIAIPLVDSSIDTADMMWIRRDWLEKLNLNPPTTMDELYDVMIAFRDKDPDGNGQDDTIGMVFHNNFLSPGLGDGVGLFNGFRAYPRAWVADGNGGLEYGSVREESKVALDYIAKMYKEGLIEADFASNDEVAASEAAASGRAGIQYGLMWNANWPLNATIQNDINADWVTIPIPSADSSEARPQIAVKINGYVVVSKNCKNPEAVVRMLNFWVDKFGYSGDERSDYLIDDGNGVLGFCQHYVMLKTWNPFNNLSVYKSINAALESGDTSSLNAEAETNYSDIQKYFSGDIIGGYGCMKTFGNDMSAFETINYYHENDLFLFDEFTTAPTTTMGAKMSIVTDKVMEYYTKVIMGEASTADFDSFISEVNALGLEQITKEVNEWYGSK
ncbi:extracellular solute-binding protein, partial [Lachnospiraceae bacterium OttesenSCG-928-D06]|nr:extracellular solute-binding protein [Lachnospiraceae bacterium OttesenSCG-928-D06]